MPLGMRFLQCVPVDVWNVISEYLNAMDRVRLFWLLWQLRVLPMHNLVSAFEMFCSAPTVSLTVVASGG